MSVIKEVREKYNSFEDFSADCVDSAIICELKDHKRTGIFRVSKCLDVKKILFCFDLEHSLTNPSQNFTCAVPWERSLE